MSEKTSLSNRLIDLLWPRDFAEVSVFGFIVVTSAALIGGLLKRYLFG